MYARKMERKKKRIEKSKKINRLLRPKKTLLLFYDLFPDKYTYI